MVDLELPEEYLQFLRENIDKIEMVTDRLGGTDERLDYVVRQLDQLPLADIPKLKMSIESLTSALEAAGIEVKMPRRTEWFSIVWTAEPATAPIIDHEPPYDGFISEVQIDWPDGCEHLVDVRVGYGGQQFVPLEGFLNLNDVNATYPFNQSVVHTVNLWLEIQNRDEFLPHTITVMFNIEETLF